MKDWLQGLKDQIIEWLVRAKKWDLWVVLVVSVFIGLFIGLFIGSKDETTQDLSVGWAGLVAGAILGVIATMVFGWASAAIDKVAQKRPLNKVLGPVAKGMVTIYLAPFARPLDSKLLRLDRTLPFDDMPPVVGTELVVGLGDTIALSFIYGTLLKAGKVATDIVINQNADLERGRWGLNCICIGAANSRTREILDSFQNTFFSFDDSYCAIVRHPHEEVTAPIVTRDGSRVEARYRKKVILEDGRDYGVILKLKDQARDEGNRIIIIAGIGADGTAGAAYYFWRHSGKLAALGDTFGVLIQTTAGHESAREVDFDSVAVLRTVQQS